MNDHADRIESIAMDLHRGHCAGLPSERWRTWGGEDDTQREHFRRAARAAIAALEAGRSGEAVAEVYHLASGDARIDFTRDEYRNLPVGTKLYAAAPQQPPPVGVTDAMESAYEQGWYECSDWAGRNDLKADVDSPAYVRQRTKRLSFLSHQQPAPSVSEDRR